MGLGSGAVYLYLRPIEDLITRFFPWPQTFVFCHAPTVAGRANAPVLVAVAAGKIRILRWFLPKAIPYDHADDRDGQNDQDDFNCFAHFR